SAWNFVAIAKYILGIRPNYDGLIIDPKLPDEIKELEVKRVVRGVTYHICVLRGPKKGLYINDKYISDHEIPYELTKKDIYVKAYI
ncbi:MAG: glycosyl transferase, partial [Paracholeplasma sp.]|nr:glycosyl transferase [Paracholeplasma sp.]